MQGADDADFDLVYDGLAPWREVAGVEHLQLQGDLAYLRTWRLKWHQQRRDKTMPFRRSGSEEVGAV